MYALEIRKLRDQVSGEMFAIHNSGIAAKGERYDQLLKVHLALLQAIEEVDSLEGLDTRHLHGIKTG